MTKLREKYNSIVDNIYEELYKAEVKNPILVLLYRPAIMFLLAVSEIIYSLVVIVSRIAKMVFKWLKR